MPVIERAQAVAVLRAARATVLKAAEVLDPPTSAADWSFTRLYDALSENILVSGRADVAISYGQLAALASHRGKGKRTTGNALRKPFGQKLWHGDILGEPFKHGDVELSIFIARPEKKGGVLQMFADFRSSEGLLTVADSKPDGPQPIIAEVERVLNEEKARATHSGIARRAVADLRAAGWDKAEELSRWFRRHGLDVAPYVFVVLFTAAVTLSAGAAVYAVVRYVVIPGLSRVVRDPDRQGELPPGGEEGELWHSEDVGHGARLEVRLLNGDTAVATLKDYPFLFRRLYPDSNFQFKWEIYRNDVLVETRVTDEPRLRFRFPQLGDNSRWRFVPAPEEYMKRESRPFSLGDRGITVSADDGSALAQAQAIAESPKLGWLTGVVTVPPHGGYSELRRSPIEATRIDKQRVRFVIRPGPVRAADHELKFSFGDGTVWESAEHGWLVEAGSTGDEWDRYTLTLEHTYPQPGRYDVRYVVFHRHDDNARHAQRQVRGTVFVDIPPPKERPTRPDEVPLQLRSGPGAAPGTYSLSASRDAQMEQGLFYAPASFSLTATQGGTFIPQIEAVSLFHDPHWVQVAVVPDVPELTTRAAHLRVVIDFGDDTPHQNATIWQASGGPALFVADHEYARSGTYKVSARVEDTATGERLPSLSRTITVSSTQPPRAH